MKRLALRLSVVSSVLLLALLLCQTAASAPMPVGDSNWFWLNPLPQGENLSGVDFVDANHGWATGANGTILATSDGGATWTRQRYVLGQSLGALSFGDATHGWAVEGVAMSTGSSVGSFALSTTDGGAHWVTRDVGATGLTDVAFASASTGWVCGEAGVLRRTTDGGATWTPYDLGDPYDTWNVTEVTCTSATHAWATLHTTTPYEDYGLATTTDGGDHWAVTKPAYGYGWSHSLTFVDDSNGFLQVQGSTVGFLATTDGGVNWTQRSSQYLTDMAFTDAMHGVAVTSGNAWSTTALVHTSDGGGTWNTVTWTPAVPGIAGWLARVTAADATHVWAVGGGGAIASSSDAGATWARDSTELASGRALRGVSYPDPLHAWVVGDNLVVATSDGGSTWTTQATPTEKVLNDVRFVDPTHGWAVGNAGTIFATTDAGTSWSAQDSGTTENLTSVAFPDATHGWVGGDGGISRTTNGGATWTAQRSGYIIAVTFPDTTHGWAVTGDSRVVRTTDGGVHWTAPRTLVKSLNPLIRMSDIVFADADRGWIVGGTVSFVTGTETAPRGLILATTDGGLTWTEQHAGTADGLSDVRFISATTGWATGGGSILRTTDGGVTWSLQAQGSGTSLLSIAFADSSHGLAVGEGAFDLAWVHRGGAIIGTTTGGVTAAPTSTASGVSAWAWYNHDVTINFSAVASPLGSPVVHTEYNLGKGAGWVDGSSCVFPASDPGITTPYPYVLSYRAVDDADNVEYTRTLVLHCDTFPPVPEAPVKASASRGRAVTLKYRVIDMYGGGTATVAIKVKNGAGKIVTSLKGGTIVTVSGSSHALLSKRFTVPRTWKPGTYRFFVYATDTAGNKQVKAASNKLIVK